LLFIPTTVVRPTGRPSLQTVEVDQAEAAQALLMFVGSSILDRGSLNPRKRAKEAILMSESDLSLQLDSVVNIGEYAEQNEKKGRQRLPNSEHIGMATPIDDELINSQERVAQKTSEQESIKTRPRVKISQSGNSERSRGRTRLSVASPPPPKSRFTILRSGLNSEGIVVSNRENILPRDQKTKKKITLLENSRRRNTTPLPTQY